MPEGTSRRGFFHRVTASAVALGGIGIAGNAESESAAVDTQQGSSEAERLSKARIDAELRRRAAFQVKQRHVVADYYRIRRRLAYPLPLDRLIIPEVPAPTIPNYPWSVWLLWALEERILALGWAAEWFQDDAARAAAARDLSALAQWPEYRQLKDPDLASAHAGYILWTACTQWTWPDAALRAAMQAGCRRHAADLLEKARAYYGGLTTKEQVLALREPHTKLHNIPFIGTVGAALTANVAGMNEAAELNDRLAALFGAILDLRSGGYTEGVGYDGYVLAFVADWLLVAPAATREAILNHPDLRHYLEESYLLGAPGSSQVLAELSDVEPKQMPWHLTAQAKLQRVQPDPVRLWHLRRCTADWLRTDALALLRDGLDTGEARPPAAGACNAHYALVLRSGYAPEDLAVAASCTNSPMGHLQCDNGSLLIGSRARWFITDPGYQQYMKDDEREFTLGPAAHNAPVLNGVAQDKKAPVLLKLEETAPACWHAGIDLRACYPSALKLRQVTRSIWLLNNTLVAVADRIQGEGIERITYHWHGHPEAAWWVRDGWVLVSCPEADLWFASPGIPLLDTYIQRLPGSRGPLSLIADANPGQAVQWWVFSMDSPSPLSVSNAGATLHLPGQELTALDLDAL